MLEIQYSGSVNSVIRIIIAQAQILNPLRRLDYKIHCSSLTMLIYETEAGMMIGIINLQRAMGGAGFDTTWVRTMGGYEVVIDDSLADGEILLQDGLEIVIRAAHEPMFKKEYKERRIKA